MANPFVSNVGSMPTDYDTEAQQIARSRKYAEMLQQQALTQDNPNQVVSGRVIQYSPLQGMAKMLQAWASAKLNNDADEQQNALAGKQQADFASDMSKFRELSTGKPAVTAPSMALNPNEDGTPQTVQVSPAVPGSRSAALAGDYKSPQMRQMMLAAQLKELERQPSDAFAKINPHDYTPESVARFSQTSDYSSLVPVRKMELAPSGQVYNPYQIQPGQVIADPNKPFSIGPNGVIPNTQYQNYELNKSRAGATNVSVNTAQKPFLNEIGKGVGESVTNAFGQAQQAATTLGNVQQIRSGLGNAILGPGANTRVTLAQIGETLGINGKDTTERLTNTRNVIQGLARQELAAAGQMKGQGQITEAERGILRRAESGDVSSFTAPELNTLLGAIEKTAKYRIGVHNQNLERLSQDPNAAPMVQYMRIPGIDTSPAAPAKPANNRQISVDW